MTEEELHQWAKDNGYVKDGIDECPLCRKEGKMPIIDGERDIIDEDARLEHELLKLTKKIEQAWTDYKVLQDMYRCYTGKEHEWLK